MNSKDDWKKTYNILIIFSCLFEGFILNAIIFAFAFGMKKTGFLLIAFITFEIFGSLTKINKYEEKWMK